MARHWEQSDWPTQIPGRKPPQIREFELLPPPEGWARDAACAGQWPEWDRDIEGESTADRQQRYQRAARVCREACPVLAECTDWAQRSKSVGATGVVAGMLATARRGKAGYYFREVA